MSTMQEVLQNYSRKEIGDFVSGYAHLPFGFSLCLYSRGCHLETQTLESMIYVSISHCIVPDNVVDILEQKAALIAYQCSETLETSIRSVKNQYEYLRSCRKSFQFSDDEVTSLIQKYAVSPLSREEFCQVEGITLSLFHKTFVRAVCTCLVTSNTISHLREKSALHSTNQPDVDKLYQILLQARSNYQHEHGIT